ncbi:MAG: glycosyltransferase family 4 protein [bacterium]
MKLLLLVLSGDAQRAREKLAELFPRASVETIPRGELETGSLTSRLKALRKHKADVFALATERLAWQRGQSLFMLFGALTGAQECVMLDAHGGVRRESRVSLLTRAPSRIARETTLSKSTVSRARRELLALEREVEQRSSRSIKNLPAPSDATPRDKDQPRIVYLRATPGPGTTAGGASSHIKGVVNGLRDLGAEVEIVSNDGIAGLDDSGLTIIGPEPMGSTRAVFDIHNNSVLTRGALPLIQLSAPDFIYQRYARFSWAGVVASLRTNRPLFLEYNGSEVWVGRHWDHVNRLDLLERYERLNLAAAACIFVVSDVERKNLERVGIPVAKIIVNPNGVDTETFRPGVGGDRVRRDLAIDADETVVGFVGTFGPWHGVLALAQAIKLVPAGSRIRYLLVGSGSLQDEMKRLLEAEYESGRAIFTGAVGHKEVPALLDGCDVLVSPHIPLAAGAEFFGSPTKLFEYMAMGKSIVASRLGQIGDVLRDEETALLVEPGNVQELAAAIIRLAQTPALREQLGTAARRDAIEHHTWKRNAAKILGAYRSSLEEQNVKVGLEPRVS